MAIMRPPPLPSVCVSNICLMLPGHSYMNFLLAIIINTYWVTQGLLNQQSCSLNFHNYAMTKGGSPFDQA